MATDLQRHTNKITYNTGTTAQLLSILLLPEWSQRVEYEELCTWQCCSSSLIRKLMKPQAWQPLFCAFIPPHHIPAGEEEVQLAGITSGCTPLERLSLLLHGLVMHGQAGERPMRTASATLPSGRTWVSRAASWAVLVSAAVRCYHQFLHQAHHWTGCMVQVAPAGLPQTDPLPHAHHVPFRNRMSWQEHHDVYLAARRLLVECYNTQTITNPWKQNVCLVNRTTEIEFTFIYINTVTR